jgi:hypothetical protein
MLDKVLDSSRMSVQEAYGNWRWFDLHLLYKLNLILTANVRETTSSYENHESKIRYIKREGILKILAMLLCGAESDQMDAINEKTIGIHGKIPIVSSGLLATGDTANHAMKFCLIDIDTSAIPCNARGLVISGDSSPLVRIKVVPEDKDLCDVDGVNTTRLDQDFTSHIEPDWDNDIQACQVVFRYKGRIIRRLSPMSVERALLSHGKVVKGNPRPGNFLDKVYVAQPASYFSGYAGRELHGPHYKPNQHPILLPFRGCPKARICVRTIYHSCGFVCVSFFKFSTSTYWAKLAKVPRDRGETIVLYRPGNKPLAEEAWDTSRWVIIM